MGRHSNETIDIGAAAKPRYQRRFEFRHAAPKKGKRKLKSPLWARLCVIVGAILLLVSSTAYAGEWFLKSRYEGNINRDDLLGSNRRGSSGSKIDGPLNFLVMGSDSRATEKYNPNDPSSRQASVEGARSDTIILVHINKAMNHAYVVSIPRDSYVQIPRYKNKSDGGKDKINAAFAWGGAPLLVTTVQNLLDTQIDYPVIVDFKAVRDLTDAVGGVDVNVDSTVTDPRSKRTFKAGINHLNGQQAEDYVRQRYGLTGSDYDRQKRQQQYLFALMNKITQQGVAHSPSKLDKLLRIATKNLTVDKSMPVTDLVYNLKGMSPSDATFLTLPMAGEHTESYAEVVDDQGVEELGQALQDDNMDQYIADYPPNDPTHGR